MLTVMSSRLRWLGLFAAVACSGGDNDEIACVAPCGGAVVGQWVVSDWCPDGPSARGDLDCPGATRDSSGLRVGGTLILQAQYTFESVLSSSGTFTDRWPLSCLAEGEVCGDRAGIDATCSVEDTDCVCVVPYEGSTSTMGSWSTTGDSLALEGFARADYCVDSGQLTMWFREGPVTDLSPIVLVRSE
jgi:hypothetical protein